ncbi:MAG: MoaD/ThiS family protein [Nitrososphaerales archaeon]
MADITLLYFGILRELTVGKKRQEKIMIEDSSSIEDLMKKLAEMHGQKFRDYVFDSKGKSRSGIAFAINGDSIDASALKMIRCKGVKEFVILPPISGGVG